MAATAATAIATTRLGAIKGREYALSRVEAAATARGAF
jgi:hypothetical protein